MFRIPIVDLHRFHTVDRNLFARLVTKIARNPGEAILAMAFWLWLERNRFPKLVTRLLNASDYVVNKIVDEAIFCLNSLAPNQPIPEVKDSTFTTTLIGGEIPLDMMHQDKSKAINGIKNVLNDVCARVFIDILEKSIGGSSEGLQNYQPINVPGFPHPIFGNVIFLKLPSNENFPVGNNIWGWNVRNYG